MGERQPRQCCDNPCDDDYGPGDNIQTAVQRNRGQTGSRWYFGAHLEDSDRISERLPEDSELSSSFRTQTKSQQASKRDLVFIFTERQSPSPSLCKMRHSCQRENVDEPPTKCHDVLPQLARASLADKIRKQGDTHYDSQNPKQELLLWRDFKHWGTSQRMDSRRSYGQRCFRR